ncbi:MAG: CRTAC1 family protein, partial [Deltaproteobacteria bacterium]|nr:CRTAC1 family protein [Deltaproteobacteria bacterium]
AAGGQAASGTMQLFLNQQRPGSDDPRDRVFVDFTAESNINAPSPGATGDSATTRHAASAAFADVDNDGTLDLITGVYYHRIESYTDLGDRIEVLLNDGQGHFTIKEGNGLHDLGLLNTTGLSFLDYDLDGNIDLYMGLWFKDYTNNKFDHDRLFRGMGDGTFVEVTGEAGIAGLLGATYGTNVADYNDDGYPDVMSSNYCRSWNRLWRNDGDGTFTEVGIESGFGLDPNLLTLPQNFCGWASMPRDFNNDGTIDFLQVLTHGFEDWGGNRYYRTCPAVNLGREAGYTFAWRPDLITRAAPTPEHHGDHYGGWFDMDNDGLADMFITESGYSTTEPFDRLYVFRHQDDHHFLDVTEALGMMGPPWGPHPAVGADLDLDGDEDLLVGYASETPPLLKVFRNEVGTQNHWLAVKLVTPPATNRSAIGARVTVQAGDLTLVQEVAAGDGNFANQKPFILHFGLGQRTSVDLVTVRWPNRDHPESLVMPEGIDRIIVVDGNLTYQYDAGVQDDAGTPDDGDGGGCGCRAGGARTAAAMLGVLGLCGAAALLQRRRRR